MTERPDLLQALEAAAAAYQRHHGRPRLLAKLAHMLARAEEAQRLMDQSKDQVGEPKARAAE